jgi:DNA-binding MarR family transcriptional regulator/uncharacterized coiled-coil protein SlyX
MSDLSLDDQRVLLAIRSSQEKDEEGHQRADFSQLREWLGWKYDRLDYRLGRLEELGFISISHRSSDEIETNRTPPRVATLTEVAIELIHNQGLKDAMFEKIPETADPRTYEEIFDRLNLIEGFLDKYRQESLTYYEKWSSVLTELRTTVNQRESEMNSLMDDLQEHRQRISMLLGTLYTEDNGSRDYSGVNEALDVLEEQIPHLRSVQSTLGKRIDKTEQETDSVQTELRDLERRVQEIEEYLRSNGHRWQPQRFVPRSE